MLLVLLVGGINAALHFLVFRPLDRARARLVGMERGHWRGPIEPTSEDGLGRFVQSFQALGLEIDALVGQALHADRLAILALMSQQLSRQLEPELQRVAQIAVRLNRRDASDAEDAGEQLARSAAAMLATVRGLDRAFPKGPR